MVFTQPTFPWVFGMTTFLSNYLAQLCGGWSKGQRYLIGKIHCTYTKVLALSKFLIQGNKANENNLTYTYATMQLSRGRYGRYRGVLERVLHAAVGALGSNLGCSTLAKSFDLNGPQFPIYKMRSVIFVFLTLQSYCVD